MNTLKNLLKEMAAEIPGLMATGVVGIDGLPIAQYAVNPKINQEVGAAQFALVLKLVQKTCKQLNDPEMEDNLVTTADIYFLTRFLGDGSYFLGIAANRNAASLGNIRLIARYYSDILWDAIPKRRV